MRCLLLARPFVAVAWDPGKLQVWNRVYAPFFVVALYFTSPVLFVVFQKQHVRFFRLRMYEY